MIILVLTAQFIGMVLLFIHILGEMFEQKLSFNINTSPAYLICLLLTFISLWLSLTHFSWFLTIGVWASIITFCLSDFSKSIIPQILVSLSAVVLWAHMISLLIFHWGCLNKEEIDGGY